MAKIKKDNLPKQVQAAGELQLHGALIDDGWLKHIQFDSGKPHLVAILILAEIVYWYRPSVITDEATGQVTEIKKKFHEDKLQKKYKDLGNRIGVSKRMAQDACKFLRDMNLITIEQRTVNCKDRKFGNVTFIEPVIENIRKISCMCKEYICPKSQNTPSNPITSECDSSLECDSPVTPERETLHRVLSTENTEIINTYNQSINPSTEENRLIDGKIDCYNSVPAETYLDFNEPDEALTGLLSPDPDYDSVKRFLKDKLRFDDLKIDRQKKPLLDSTLIEEIELNIMEMFFAESIKINGKNVQNLFIQKAIDRLTPSHIMELVERYKEASETKSIKNTKAYIQTMIYNIAYDFDLAIRNKIENNRD